MSSVAALGVKQVEQEQLCSSGFCDMNAQHYFTARKIVHRLFFT
jgi:hypothetical protein